MKVYLIRHEEREKHIGLVGHRDYIFATKELAVQFCLENSRYKDETWIQEDAYMRSLSGASTTDVLVIEEKELHWNIPDIKSIWERDEE